MKLLNGNDSAVFENTESNSVANLTEELVKETIERFKNKGIGHYIVKNVITWTPSSSRSRCELVQTLIFFKP